MSSSLLTQYPLHTHTEVLFEGFEPLIGPASVQYANDEDWLQRRKWLYPTLKGEDLKSYFPHFVKIAQVDSHTILYSGLIPKPLHRWLSLYYDFSCVLCVCFTEVGVGIRLVTRDLCTVDAIREQLVVNR